MRVGLGDYSERFEINRGYQAVTLRVLSTYYILVPHALVQFQEQLSLPPPPPEMKTQQLTKHLNDYSEGHAILHDYYNHHIDCFEHLNSEQLLLSLIP